MEWFQLDRVEVHNQDSTEYLLIIMLFPTYTNHSSDETVFPSTII